MGEKRDLERTNYMKFSEYLWTRAPDLQIQVKQTEEKNSSPFQAVGRGPEGANNSVLHLGFAWAF